MTGVKRVDVWVTCHVRGWFAVSKGRGTRQGPKGLGTGAIGHVGDNLCKVLVARGHDVRATVRDAADGSQADPVRALGASDVVSLDVQDAEGFRAAEGHARD